MTTKNNLFRLSGKIQHYQWGGYQFIPDLLGIANPEFKPYAEYWLGAHENASSEIITEEGSIALNQLIREQPDLLGEAVLKTFDTLPYLMKVLDVRDMLSIQVHPSKKAAMEEFQRENREGVALNAPERNYKDNNHKPELMVALSDFWLLHGFKSREKIIELAASIPEFAFMEPLLNEGGYQKLYGRLMTMDQQEVNQILRPLLERIESAYAIDYLPKGMAHFWAARAAQTFRQQGIIDRGIFSVYLLNLVHLKEGEAIFQDAGVLHAYLEGKNMEIMANSDNVLRGGLTPKHVDVKELMKHVYFEETVPQVIKGVKNETEETFPAPVKDFSLSRISLNDTSVFKTILNTAEIFLVLHGRVTVVGNRGELLALNQGESVVGFAGEEISIASSGEAVLYRAGCPVWSE